MIERDPAEVRAFLVVHAIAQHGAEAAIAQYGRPACDRARYMLRAIIAIRQTNRARQDGAQGKKLARMQYLDNRRRMFERESRRAYRAAARYSRTHLEASARAQQALIRANTDRTAHHP